MEIAFCYVFTVNICLSPSENVLMFRIKETKNISRRFSADGSAELAKGMWKYCKFISFIILVA